MSRLASVYPIVSARSLARPFTYKIEDEVEKGAVLAIRFGNARRRGVVVDADAEAPPDIEPVAAERVLETLPPSLVDLALWLADYYGSTPARALALVAPETPKRRKEQSPPAERQALTGEAEPAQLSEPQRAAVARIVVPQARQWSAGAIPRRFRSRIALPRFSATRRRASSSGAESG